MYKQNSKYKSVTIKLSYAFIVGLFVAIFLFILVNSISKWLLDDYFLTSSYIRNAELKHIEQFQDFVLEENIAATDYIKIRKWEKNNKILVLTISRDRVLLYDNSYAGSIPLIETDSQQLHTTFQYFCPVTFADGVADVFIYKDYAKKHYNIVNFASVFISILLGMLIFIFLIKKEVKYLILLKNEAELLHHDKLNPRFTIKGNDELTELANTLNQMLCSLAEKEAFEREIKIKEEKLVLGLAHDLRTPLTGLMGYLELCKKEMNTDALERAIQKVFQVRDLSDKLLEFFLSSQDKPLDLVPPAVACSILGDYFSELCLQLSSAGFCINIDALVWDNVLIQINSDSLGRIINNISSNIIRYALPNSEVLIASKYENNMAYYIISNKINTQPSPIKGTKIGLTNISNMMSQMNGSAIFETKGNCFYTTLAFPCLIAEETIIS